MISPGLESLSDCGFVRQFNSSSRFRISSPHVSRALQRLQSEWWILKRDNRQHLKFTPTSLDSFH
jgi:hypothetical protein